MTPEAAATRVVQHTLARPPTLGAGRLVCVDGPAGSGKTSLADAVARRTDAQVVHMDDLYGGWDGLLFVAGHVERLLRPLAQGLHGHWQRYDWHAGRFAEWHQVRPGGLLLLEGVGSGARAWAALTTTLVYVEAPRSVRLGAGWTATAMRRQTTGDGSWSRRTCCSPASGPGPAPTSSYPRPESGS